MSKDWSKIYKKYKGLWVALADDEMTVLGVGKTVKEAINEAKKKSSMAPILTRIPRTLDAYVSSL